MPFRLAMASNSSASNTREISSESKETALMIGIVNLLVGIIAVVGNSALCLTIYQDPFRRLRSTANYLVVNLAIADLLTGLITEPLYAAYEITSYIGKEAYTLYIIGESTAYVFVNASIWSILLLAWDRYVAVASPLLHAQKMDLKRILTMIILLWIYSIIFSLLRFMGVPEDIFYWVDLHVNYTLFGAILIWLYISIYYKIRNQLALSLQAQGFNSQTKRKPTHDEIQANAKSEKKMTKTVFLLLLVAILCMLPLYIMLHVELLCESCMEISMVKILSRLSEPLLFLNSGLNPFLYAWTIPKYRQAFKAILRRTRCDQRTNNQNIEEGETSTSGKKPLNTYCIHKQKVFTSQETSLPNWKGSSKDITVQLLKLRINNCM